MAPAQSPDEASSPLLLVTLLATVAVIGVNVPIAYSLARLVGSGPELPPALLVGLLLLGVLSAVAAGTTWRRHIQAHRR